MSGFFFFTFLMDDLSVVETFIIAGGHVRGIAVENQTLSFCLLGNRCMNLGEARTQGCSL